MKSHRRYKQGAAWAALLMGGLGTGARGAEAAAAVQSWPANAVIRFAATSTLHDFGGQLPAQPFTLVLSNRTWSAQADVLAGQMATANAKRDRNLHAMINTNSFPLLHGSVTAAPVPTSAGTNATLKLKIRDRESDLPVQVTAWEESATEIRFHAAWELSLRQYGLKPPSVIGLIRVGDRVHLEADVTARKNPGLPLPAPTT